MLSKFSTWPASVTKQQLCMVVVDVKKLLHTFKGFNMASSGHKTATVHGCGRCQQNLLHTLTSFDMASNSHKAATAHGCGICKKKTYFILLTGFDMASFSHKTTIHGSDRYKEKSYIILDPMASINHKTTTVHGSGGNKKNNLRKITFSQVLT